MQEGHTVRPYAAFAELLALMTQEGFAGVAETAEYWSATLKDRR